MGYGDYTPMADKFLLPDGSITTFDNVEVLPADVARATLYTKRAAAAAKWLLPDGSITSGLPVTITTATPTGYIGFDTTPVGVPDSQGVLSWNETDKTLDLNLGSSVKLQIGQEMFMRVVNKTGSILTNGSVVYISGAQGNRPTAAKAVNTNSTHCSKVIGMVTADIAINQEGYVTTNGLVRDLNTNALSEGDLLYLSDVAGEYTTTVPAVGKARVIIGTVTKSHINDGWILIRIIQDKYRFGDIANGNYSFFEDDGTLVCAGNAITYRDEYVGGEWFTPQGATAPDVESYTIGGVATRKHAFDGVNVNETLSNTFEIAHDSAISLINAGTLPMEFHTHAAPSTTGSGTYRFTIDWCYIPPNGAPIAMTQLVIEKAINNQQYHNVLSGVELSVPAGGYAIGGIIEFTLTRTPQHTNDTYAADVILYKAALHIPCDMLGSRQRYIK